MEAANLSWEEIDIGDSSTFSRSCSKEDVANFALLSGDFNPLHTDAVYASTTEFGAPLVHGMLIASLISRFVGMYIPGKRCLLLKNEIQFKKPVFINDEIIVTGNVESKSNATKLIVINIQFHINLILVAESKVCVKVI